MSTQKIGSYDWCKETNGILSKKEKKKLVQQLVISQVTNHLSALSYRIGLTKHDLKKIDLDKIKFPESKAGKEALSYATDQCSQVLLNHCYRTFVFGELIAQVKGIHSIDHELLFVGSILHDLGLTNKDNENLCSCCFTMEGAKVAKSIAEKNSWNERRSVKLYTSISAHLNPKIDSKIYGNESFLLGSGALLDVLGTRHHTIPPLILKKVHDKYPRAQFKNDIIKTMSFPHQKDSRAGYLYRLGFSKFAKDNPLDRLYS
ncbi:HD domain-containing protein [Zhouia amylolytica]|uniref:HD domain-containing protein n=1 Tax=Zhouia amylolytica AD3 TaxID=1286632 RepID=W2UMM5_9FLAO|nr:hypothetical protein [Zhouia amylolytica]ETN95400.1 hypothetical protein P278_11220 [Zhouia amylolytica AD3]